MFYNPFLELDGRISYDELPEEMKQKVDSKKIKPYEFHD